MSVVVVVFSCFLFSLVIDDHCYSTTIKYPQPFSVRVFALMMMDSDEEIEEKTNQKVL